MSKITRTIGSVLLSVCLVLGFMYTSLALAKEFPSKPIKLIIPYPPGGSHDAHGRAFAGVAHQYFGVPVLAVIKGGGGGSIGANYVAQSKADGYTLLLGDQQSVIAKPLIEKLPYAFDSFVAVGRINYSPMLISVHADAPWKSLKELVAYARKHPNEVSYGGVPGLGVEQLTMDPFLIKAEIELKFIPFSGGGPAFKAFLSKDIDILVAFASTVADYIKEGKVRALAVSSPERLPQFPNVSTIMEQGYDHQFAMFRTVFAPKNISDSRLKKLRESFAQTAKDKSFQSIVRRMGERVLYMSGEDFEKFKQEEAARIKVVVEKLFGK